MKSDLEKHREIFEKTCAHYGLVPYDASQADLHLPETKLLAFGRDRSFEWVNEFKRNHCKKMHRIYFDYVDNPRLNAFAFYYPDTKSGFICVHTGAVRLIFDLFYRLLSHPDVLTMIGNPSAESVKTHIYSEEISNDFDVACALRGASGDRFADVFPQDTRRRKYAEKLAEIALEFLVLHELSHLSAGHCEYSQARGKSAPLLMELGPSLPTIAPLTKQWFEYMADGCAAVITWIGRLNRLTDDEKIARGKYDSGTELVIPERLLMFDWVFSVTFLFWMFDVDTDPNSLNTSQHPPAFHRVVLANAHVFRALRLHDSEERQNDFEVARMEAARQVDKALTVISATKTNAKMQFYMRLFYDGTLYRHYERVMAEGAKIESDLQQFNRFDMQPITASDSPPALPPQTPP
jgi:hypothetical protein